MPGTVGPSSLAPNRFWPADLGGTGRPLVANVIWGRLGGTPSSVKNRSWMDICGNQSGVEGGGLRLARPLSFALGGEAGRRRNRVRRVTGTGELAVPRRGDRAGPSAAPAAA